MNRCVLLVAYLYQDSQAKYRSCRDVPRKDMKDTQRRNQYHHPDIGRRETPELSAYQPKRKSRRYHKRQCKDQCKYQRHLSCETR